MPPTLLKPRHRRGLGMRREKTVGNTAHGRAVRRVRLPRLRVSRDNRQKRHSPRDDHYRPRKHVPLRHARTRTRNMRTAVRAVTRAARCYQSFTRDVIVFRLPLHTCAATVRPRGTALFPVCSRRPPGPRGSRETDGAAGTARRHKSNRSGNDREGRTRETKTESVEKTPFDVVWPNRS